MNYLREKVFFFLSENATNAIKLLINEDKAVNCYCVENNKFQKNVSNITNAN